MSTRFELRSDEHGRVAFCLFDDDGELLLQGLPCKGKIAAQTEVMHARKSVRVPERFVAHADDEGHHFFVLKDDDGSVLARSRQVASPNELPSLIGTISEAGAGAPIIDRTRRLARR